MFFSARDLISNFFSKTTRLLNLPVCSLFDHGRKSALSVVIICLSFYGSVSLGESPTQEAKHLVIGKKHESKRISYKFFGFQFVQGRGLARVGGA